MISQKVRSRRHYLKHTKRVLNRNNRWYFKNRQSRLKKMSEYHKKIYDRARSDVFKILGNSCSRCGFDDKRALQIDHVNGDGAKEKRNFNNNALSLLKRVVDKPKEYQILCANCNWIKRHENNEGGGHSKWLN